MLSVNQTNFWCNNETVMYAKKTLEWKNIRSLSVQFYWYRTWPYQELKIRWSKVRNHFMRRLLAFRIYTANSQSNRFGFSSIYKRIIGSISKSCLLTATFKTWAILVVKIWIHTPDHLFSRVNKAKNFS